MPDPTRSSAHPSAVPLHRSAQESSLASALLRMGPSEQTNTKATASTLPDKKLISMCPPIVGFVRSIDSSGLAVKPIAFPGLPSWNRRGGAKRRGGRSQAIVRTAFEEDCL